MSCTMHTLASSSVSGTPTAAPAKEEKKRNNFLMKYLISNCGAKVKVKPPEGSFWPTRCVNCTSNIFVCFIVF